MNKESSLTFRQKVFYGIGETTPTLSNTIIGFLYVFFLTNVVGLDPALAGAVFLIGSCWDAFTDPLAGHISDSTRSKFGRRRIFFLIFALPYCVTFFFLWAMPIGLPQSMLFVTALLLYMLYITVSTFYTVPFTSFCMEMEGKYDARTSLMAYRFFFSILFGLVAAALPEMITTSSVDPSIPEGMPSAAGYILMATAFSIPLIVGPIFAFFSYKEPAYNNSPKTKLFSDFKLVFTNKQFIRALVMYVTCWTSIGFVQGMLLYFLNTGLRGQKDTLFNEYLSDLFPIIAVVIMGMAVAALPIWVKISKKMDKKRALILSMIIFGAFALCLTLPPDVIGAIIWPLIVILGFAMSAMHLLTNAIIPEAIEVGEREKGAQAEGVYFGVTTFMQKIALALSMQIALIVMQLFGYISTVQGQVVNQPESSVIVIRIMMGIVPFLLCLFGVIASRKFTITRDTVE